MVDGSSALWFGAPNFRVLDVVDDGHELTISLESTATVTGCVACGTRAKAKDRRWVSLRDAPSGGRAIVLRVWRRIWSCPDGDCPAKTWTEACQFAGPRRVLTTRAVVWATERIAAIEGTVASIARGFGVSWPTVWAAVERIGRERVEDPARVGETAMVGFDETVMQPAHRRRRRRFITAVVDVTNGQILDVFEGRDAADLRAWLAGMPTSWRAAVEVVSVDPHEGYRSALTDTVLLHDIALVVDPFHIVRLANQAVTRCRQRIQHDTLGHRGWARDPLYATRKLFLLGAERVDETGWERIWGALADGDPDGELQDCWVAKEKIRDVYLTDDPTEAEHALDGAIAWCSAAEAGPELRRLAKTLRRWRTQILNHHTPYRAQAEVDARLTNGADVTVTQSPGTSVGPAGTRAIERVPGVRGVEPLQHRFAYVGADLQDLYGVRTNTIVDATKLQDAYFQGGSARGLMARLAQQRDGVLVSAETVKDFQLRSGDTLTLRLQDGRTKQYRPVRFRYIGVAKEFPTAPRDSFLVANADYVTQQTGSDAVGAFLVDTGGTTPKAVANRLRLTLGPAVTVTDLATTRKVVGSTLTAVDLSGLTKVELGFAVVLAAAATGLVLALGLAERRRTFAIVAALGAKRRQLGGFVWAEAVFVTGAGFLLGGLTAWVLSEMLVKVLTGVFDPHPAALAIPWAYLGVVTGVAVAAVGAAAVTAIRSSSRPSTSILREL